MQLDNKTKKKPMYMYRYNLLHLSIFAQKFLSKPARDICACHKISGVNFSIMSVTSTKYKVFNVFISKSCN